MWLLIDTNCAGIVKTRGFSLSHQNVSSRTQQTQILAKEVCSWHFWKGNVTAKLQGAFQSFASLEKLSDFKAAKGANAYLQVTQTSLAHSDGVGSAQKISISFKDSFKLSINCGLIPTLVTGNDQLGQAVSTVLPLTQMWSPRRNPASFIVLGCTNSISSLLCFGKCSAAAKTRAHWRSELNKGAYQRRSRTYLHRFVTALCHALLITSCNHEFQYLPQGTTTTMWGLPYWIMAEAIRKGYEN